MTSSPTSRRPLDAGPRALLARWAARAGPPSPRVAAVHERLLAAALDVAPASVAVRRPSMCHDGTPLVYSVALDGPAPSPLRLLVEPGGLGVDVPAQIAGALATLDALLADEEPGPARDQIATIARIVFPDRPALARGWWGGAWLGLVADPGALELRLYANLRWGDARARWQRAFDAICAFADERLGPTLEDLLAHVGPIAIPVGLGVGIRRGAVRALRLYAGVHAPEPSAIRSALPERVAGGADAAVELCERFERRFGPLGAQSATLGLDLLLDRDGTVAPGVARAKVDVSCQALAPERRGEAWRLARELAGDASELDAFAGDLDAAFGGGDVEFLSVSARPERSSLSVYAKPAGLAR